MANACLSNLFTTAIIACLCAFPLLLSLSYRSLHVALYFLAERAAIYRHFLTSDMPILHIFAFPCLAPRGQPLSGRAGRRASGVEGDGARTRRLPRLPGGERRLRALSLWADVHCPAATSATRCAAATSRSSRTPADYSAGSEPTKLLEDGGRDRD